MKKLFFSVCFSFVAVAAFAQDEEQDKEIVTTDLEEVIVMSGIIDLAKDRKTPIAVSNITTSEIERKGGSFDLIEVMRSTPSVQINRGSGFGDGKMYLRGFDQTNTAFLINGQPINGVEDGKMYWSNWSGMIDVAEEIEIQRGLGSSKLAISSVGGTVNIVTKTVDAKEGGVYKSMIGNDNYFKNSLYLSSGLNDNGWAYAMFLGHWSGDGYMQFSKGQGQTYYFSVGYKPNDSNVFNAFITGAPQWHGSGGGENLQKYLDEGFDYADWGGVRNGEIYPGGRNFYHKPIYNLSWDWTINDNSSLSTVLYGSHGRGGFAYNEGEFYYTDQGMTDYDKIIAENAAGNSEGIVKASVNGHNWYGAVSNYSSQINENLSFNLGFDFRFYNGIHFRTPTDYLGLSSYKGATKSYGYNPWDAVFDFPKGSRDDYHISYDYEEDITYSGLFGQLEYSNENSSYYFQGAVSSQSHLKEDFMFDLGKAEEVTNTGYNLKVGGSTSVGDYSKVYANFGFYSRQPFHDDLYANIRYSNNLNIGGAENQEITGIELGYVYEKDSFKAIIDLYSTTWDNRILSSTEYDDDNVILSYSQSDPISQVHKGIEGQFFYKPSMDIMLKAYFSLGDWTYNSNVKSTTFNEAGQTLSEGDVAYLDGVKVGDAAQTTGGIEMMYIVNDRSRVDLSLNHYADLYARVNFSDDIFENAGNSGTIKLPSHTLVDLSYTMDIPLKDNNLEARLGIFNLFDTKYIEEMTRNNPVTGDSTVWRGIDTSNRVDPGYQRTWTLGFKYKF
jgi:outer membrane receptor protein involved in Fe transport